MKMLKVWHIHMSLSKFRLKMLQKIAQAQGEQANPGGTQTNVPATSNNTQVPQDSSPPASDLYNIRGGYDSTRVGIINGLVKILSTAANTATNGKYNLQILRNQNFTFDPSEFTSPDQKNLMVFFQKVYKTLLNNGQEFAQPVNATQLSNMVNFLLQSPELANLSQVNPTGQIAQKAPPGNFKDNIREQLARLQPTVPTRRA
jgi:hypothetical protein